MQFHNNYEHISFRKAWELTPSISRLLGECVAYITAISETPIMPQYRAKLLQVSLRKGAHATTAIEGNTLSIEEIEEIQNGNKTLPPSKEYLKLEVENVISAMNFIMKKLIDKKEIELISPKLVAHFHRLIGRNIGEAFNATPGSYRSNNVIVSSYRPPSFSEVVKYMESLCEWLKPEFHFTENKDIADSIIQAIVTHLYIAWIHPFSDGNGRTARLVEFYILMRAGVPSIASHVLSNHYNETRTMYSRKIEIATAEKDITGFIEYALEGYRDGLIEVLKTVQESQMNLSWKSLIFETFNEYKKDNHKLTEIMKRRRELILSLNYSTVIDTSNLKSLSLEIISLYQSVTLKTFKRDIDWLISIDLLRKEGKKIIVNKDVLRNHMARRVQH